MFRLSNGEVLTEELRQGNEAADEHAKLAVAEHRVDLHTRQATGMQDQHAKAVAVRVAHATFHANEGTVGYVSPLTAVLARCLRIHLS